MTLDEYRAKFNVRQTKNKFNRIVFGKMIDELLYGVALTDKQMTKAAEEIYFYFVDNDARYLIEDLTLCSYFENFGTENEVKIKSWLEKSNGYILNSLDIANLIHRLKY